MKKIDIHKKLLKYKKQIYNFSDFKKIFELKNDNSAYHAIKRLKKDEIISSLTNGKYYLIDNPPNDFQVANNLYFPSYISLESALNYYGILIQVPQMIFSISAKKRKKINWERKEFIYLHISNEYFFDYIKEKDFLIATPEKALIDTIFFNSIGKWVTDFDELLLDNVNKKRLLKIRDKIKNKSFLKLFKDLKL